MSDVLIATQRFLVPATAQNGTVDLTIAGLGWTPKGAIFKTGSARNQDLNDNGMCRIMGASFNDSGTIVQRVVGALSEHGGTGTDVLRVGYTDHALYFSDTNKTVDGKWSVGAFIADGARVQQTQSTTPFAAYYVDVIFFGGADLNIDVRSLNLGTGSSPIATIGLGFQPNLLFALGHNDNITASGSFYVTTYGIGYDNAGSVVQKSYMQTNNGDSKATEQVTALMLNKIGAQLLDGGSVSHSYNLDSFDADGFTVTPSSSTGNDELIIISIDTNDRAVWVGEIASPTTAASDWVVNEIGFTPIVAGIVGTQLATVGTFIKGTLACSTTEMYFDDITNDAHSTSSYSEYNTATINNGGRASTKAFWMADDAGTELYSADNPSFNSNGLTFAAADITAVDATSRLFFGWAIEADTVGGAAELAAAAGVFTLTGANAGLSADKGLTAVIVSYALSGIDATLSVDRSLSAVSQGYTLSGIDAALTYTPVSGNFALTADTGGLTLTGVAAGLKADRFLVAIANSVVLNGIDVTFSSGFSLPAAFGNFTLTGFDVALDAITKLVADQQTYALMGFSVNFTFDGATQWTEQAKTSATWTEQGLTSTTWTNQ